MTTKLSHNFWANDTIRLRALEPEDASFFFEWNQDSDMPRNLDYVWFPNSKASVEKWAKETTEKRGNNDEFFMVIEDNGGNLVGMIHPHRCDRRVGNFAYGVAIRRAYQRQGYAGQAIKLVLRYFFLELRYQKVTVDVASYNAPSVMLHEKLGFEREGRLRRTFFANGQFFDTLVFGMTREEFEERWT